MLSPADLAVIERDPALPGLPLILDPEALALRLGPSCPSPSYFRYKHATSCVAGFLDGYGRMPFAAKAYSPTRYQEIRARPEWLEGPTPAELFDDVCIAFVPMSFDRDLRAASPLSSPEARSRLLRQITRRRMREGFALTVLRYKPGRRIVARLDAAGRPRALIKAYAPGDFPAALAGANAAAPLGGAPVLGNHPGRHIIAFEWIKGKLACPAADGLASESEFRRIGARLAEIHSHAIHHLRSEGRESEAQAVRESLDAYTVLSPDDAEEAARFGRAVIEALAHIPFTSCMIHGDFSADQVVLRRTGPAFIDWDRACVGDPARDLGSFLARLDAQAIDGVLSTAEAEAAQAALISGYSERAGALPPSARVHHARSLLLLLPEGFRMRSRAWPERAERLLNRADRILSCFKRRSAGERTENIPQLKAALDWELMQKRLPELLGGDPAPTDLEEAELMRLKPGVRALIRYRLARDGHALTLLGKLRAVGPDRRTPALHDALRAAGLDGRGPICVGVPRSRGRIDSLHLWLQDAVPGRMATEFLVPGGDTSASRQAGAALAILHRTSVPTERRWTDQDELGVLERALANARLKLPQEGPRLDAILKAARQLAGLLRPAQMTGIHRDFYPDQILIDGKASWIVDLDLYASGDPAIDVGNYLAHIIELSLRRHSDSMALAAHATAFVDGYDRLNGPADGKRIGAMQTISLCRHIYISMRFPDRCHITLPLIGICEDLLAAGCCWLQTRHRLSARP